MTDRTVPRRRRRSATLVVAILTLAGLLAAPGSPALGAGPAVAAPLHPGTFHPISALRVLDTTAAAGGTVTFTIGGQPGVPTTGIGAVVLNLTVASPSSSGYLTAYAAGSARPRTSNVNFSAGRTTANLAVVPVGAGGKVTLFNASGSKNRLVADLSGYVEAGAPADAGGFQSLTPARLLDTRIGLGAPAGSSAGGQTAALTVAGHGGVPATGVAAVVLNVTVASPQASGYETVYPSGTTRPGTSTLNFPAGRTVANLDVVKLGADGKVDLYTASLGRVGLVADVFGYFTSGTPSRAGTFESLAPSRIMDTRRNLGVTGIVPAHGAVSLDVNGKGGLPAYGGGAVAVNVTATGSTTSGYLSVNPANVVKPATSNLNYTAGQTVANMVVVPPTGDGTLLIKNSSNGAVQVIVDVSGAFVPVPAIHFRGSESMTDTAGTPSVSCPTTSFCLASTPSGRVAMYDGHAWSTPQAIFPGDEAMQVSCPTTTFCLALSRLGHSRVFNGTTWSAPLTLGSTHTFGTFGLTCGSASFCLSFGFSDGLLHRFNGTAWSTMPSPSSTFTDLLSCSSSTFCVLVDDVERAYRYTGSVWTTATTLFEAPAALSCTSTTFCLYRDDLGESQTYNGTSWSSPNVNAPHGRNGSTSCVSPTFCVDGSSNEVAKFDGSTWSGFAAAGGAQYVSCASTTFCAVESADGYVSTFDGSTLSSPTGLDPIVGSATAISCASASFCLAVTDQGDSLVRTASGWQPAQTVARGVPLVDVSCASSTFCAAISDDSGWTYNGTAWSAATPFVPGGSGQLRVFCPSNTSCIASNGARYETFNGTSWSAANLMYDPAGSVLAGGVYLTCPTATYCANGHYDGTFSEWGGTPGSYWTAGSPAGDPRIALACASETFCASADLSGRIQFRSGATWSALQPVVPTASELTTLTCLTTTFCLATDGDGIAYTWDGEVWTTTTSSPIAFGPGGVSCATPTFCVGVKGVTATVGGPA